MSITVYCYGWRDEDAGLSEFFPLKSIALDAAQVRANELKDGVDVWALTTDDKFTPAQNFVFALNDWIDGHFGRVWLGPSEIVARAEPRQE